MRKFMELKAGQEMRDGILYDKKNNIKLGQYEFDKVQIDTLSYVPLSKKVLNILNGTMDFKADPDVQTDYDEPESDDWNSRSEEFEDSVEFQPFDEYSDKTDVIDIYKELSDKVSATKVVEGIDTVEQAKNVQEIQENGDLKEKITNES